MIMWVPFETSGNNENRALILQGLSQVLIQSLVCTCVDSSKLYYSTAVTDPTIHTYDDSSRTVLEYHRSFYSNGTPVMA